MADVEILESASGGLKLLLSGHIYYKESTRKSKTYWVCTL